MLLNLIKKKQRKKSQYLLNSKVLLSLSLHFKAQIIQQQKNKNATRNLK